MTTTTKNPLAILCLCLGLATHAHADDYEDGMAAARAGDYAGAAQAWRVGAKGGDARAQFGLGVLCLEGKGVEKDPARAAAWFEAAAERGYRLAQFNLGNAYQYGQGVQQNDQLAVYWWEKAADQGFARAQYNLGMQYYFGRGVDKDLDTALVWYRKAAAQGYPPAIEVLENLSTADKVIPIAAPTGSGPAPAASPDEPAPGPSSGDAWVLRQPAKHYTLQLMSTRDRNGAREFIQEHGLGEHAAMFSWLRDGRRLYTVIFGSYANATQAREVLESLSEPLRANQPWARRFSGVQKLIRERTQAQ